MFTWKSFFSLAVALATCFQSVFTQVSIGGLSVQNAAQQLEEIDTKYGTFTANAGFPILRYESGAIKSFYIEGQGNPATAKFHHPEYNADIIVATPVPDVDYMSQRAAQPLEFWENGNIKTLRLADAKYEGNENGYLNIVFEKYNESLALLPKSTIHFHENGRIESIKVAHGQSFKFLRDLKETEKSNPAFKNQSEIVFYDDGSIKEFTPQGAKIKNPFNFSIRQGYPVVVSREDPTTAISFYPENGSSLVLSETVKVNCIQGEPVVFYEDGKTLKQISWYFDTINFSIGKIHFYSGLNGETTKQTVNFSETGAISSVSGVLEMDPWRFGETKKSSYPTMIEGQAASVRQIDYDKAGNVKMVDFGGKPIEISSTRTKQGVQTIRAWKVYYKEGARVAAIGNVHLSSPRGSFYDTRYNCIVVMNGSEVLETIKASSDVNLTADSELVFDESGRLASYSGIDGNGKTVVISL